MSTIQIHGFSPSTYTRTARMACIEKGVAHTLEPLAFGEPAHRALHPFMKMPAMRHGDVHLYETMAIVEYIDSAFGGPALKPAEPGQRAQMYCGISAVIDYLYPGAVGILTAQAAPEEQALADARGRLSIFNDGLSTNSWLAGDDLTLADLFLAPIVAFIAANESGTRLLDGMAGIADWRQLIEARPSFIETQS